MTSAQRLSLARLAVGLLLFGFLAQPAAAQQSCNARNMVGLWKLISEAPVVDAPETRVTQTEVTAEYLEMRSGLLFWIVQPKEGPRTRSRHRAYFAGSKVDVQPTLDRAPQIVRCMRRGRSLTLLTASADGQRSGRLEFRRTGG